MNERTERGVAQLLSKETAFEGDEVDMFIHENLTRNLNNPPHDINKSVLELKD